MIQVTNEETMWFLHFLDHFGCLQKKISSSLRRIFVSTDQTFTIHCMCRYRAAWVAILYFKSLRKLPELSLTHFLQVLYVSYSTVTYFSILLKP